MLVKILRAIRDFFIALFIVALLTAVSMGAGYFQGRKDFCPCDLPTVTTPPTKPKETWC